MTELFRARSIPFIKLARAWITSARKTKHRLTC